MKRSIGWFAICVFSWLGHTYCQERTAKEPVWSDEFNGARIDEKIWTYDVGGHGFGNGQLEYNTARRENSYIENGSLVIEARREEYRGKSFTSARMLTRGRFAFKYGTLEARIKVPDTADGVWPAFWMLGNNFPAVQWPNCGETDILEIGGKEGIAKGLQHRKINCALHFSDANGKKTSRVAWFDAPDDLHRDYHLYRVSWTPTHMKFFLDDREFGSWDITATHLREYHQPCFPILNVAVGSWTSSYTAIDTPDKVTAAFPARMYVDWIRLYSNPHTQKCLGSEAEKSGNFGIYTETKPVRSSLGYANRSASDFPYEDGAALLTWNNMAKAAKAGIASEGNECWSFDVASGDWFGMGVLLPNHRNMKNYSNGFLHFDIRSKSPVAMKVGVKSSRGGEFWISLGNEKAEFGFPRDGEWHSVRVPLNRYANTDFHTIHQMFMIAGDAPSSKFNLSIDNVWWQPSIASPTPEKGEFGVFTETALHRSAGAFTPGEDGNFFIWEDTLARGKQEPFEGDQSISLRSVRGADWSGAAFTPNLKHNLTAFSHLESRLRLAMKTRSKTTFMIGMKSGNINGVGQKWITFKAGSDPYGFVRDGKWRSIEIPMHEIAKEVDLSQVSQLFQVLSVDGPISEIEFDDIRFTGGGSAQRD